MSTDQPLSTFYAKCRAGGPFTLFSLAVILSAPAILLPGRTSGVALVFVVALTVLAARIGKVTGRIGQKHEEENLHHSKLFTAIGFVAASVSAILFFKLCCGSPLIIFSSLALLVAWGGCLLSGWDNPAKSDTQSFDVLDAKDMIPGEPFGTNAENRLVLMMDFESLADRMKDAINEAADSHIDALKKRIDWVNLDLKTRGLVEGVLRLAKMIMPKSLTDEFNKPLTQSGYAGTTNTYTANLKESDIKEIARIRESMDPMNEQTGKLKTELKEVLSPEMSEAEAVRRCVLIHKKHGYANPNEYIELYSQRLGGYQKVSEYMQMVANRPEEEAAEAIPDDEMVSPVEKLIQKVFEQLPPNVQRELPIFIADLSLELVTLRQTIAVEHIRQQLEHLYGAAGK